MKKMSRVVRALVDRGEPFRAKDVVTQGVSPACIRMNPLLFIKKLERGVYGSVQRFYPRIVIATVRTRSFACLHSALWLHGLIEEEPAEAWICIRIKARKPTPGKTPTQVVRTSLSVHREDLCLAGRWAVPTATLARTAVDFVRMRHRVGIEASIAAVQLILGSGKCSQAEIDACAARLKMRRVEGSATDRGAGTDGSDRGSRSLSGSEREGVVVPDGGADR